MEQVISEANEKLDEAKSSLAILEASYSEAANNLENLRRETLRASVEVEACQRVVDMVAKLAGSKEG